MTRQNIILRWFYFALDLCLSCINKFTNKNFYILLLIVGKHSKVSFRFISPHSLIIIHNVSTQTKCENSFLEEILFMKNFCTFNERTNLSTLCLLLRLFIDLSEPDSRIDTLQFSFHHFINNELSLQAPSRRLLFK